MILIFLTDFSVLNNYDKMHILEMHKNLQIFSKFIYKPKIGHLCYLFYSKYKYSPRYCILTYALCFLSSLVRAEKTTVYLNSLYKVNVPEASKGLKGVGSLGVKLATITGDW